MRKLLPILQIIDLVLLLLSLYFHNDMLLIVAAVVIAVCVVLTFSNMKNKRYPPVCCTRFQQGLGQARPNKNTIKTQQMSER